MLGAARLAALTLTLTPTLTLTLTPILTPTLTPTRRASLRSRKLAEFLSLLLDVLNWKLGQGSPLSRAQFWEAFELCEAMAQHLAPAEAEAATCPAACSKCSLGTTPARLLCLLRARLAALGSSALPGRGRPTGRPGTASAARASRLQSRRFHRL